MTIRCRRDVYFQLQTLARALGLVAQPHIRSTAQDVAALTRAHQLGPEVLASITPTQYINRFSEPISRCFLQPLLDRNLRLERAKPLPHLTRIDRAQSAADSALITIIDMLIAANDPQAQPPASEAVSQDIFTVTCTFFVLYISCANGVLSYQYTVQEQ